MKITTFNINVEKLFLRFNLMIAVVVAAFATGYPLLGLCAVPIFLITLLGIEIELVNKPTESISHKTLPVSRIVAA